MTFPGNRRWVVTGAFSDVGGAVMKNIKVGCGAASVLAESCVSVAVDAAMRDLDGAQPVAAMIYAPYEGVAHRELVDQVRKLSGVDCIVGGTTFGEITAGQPVDDHVVVTLVGGKGIVAGVGVGRGLARDPRGIAHSAVGAAISALGDEDPALLVLFYDPMLADMSAMLAGVHDHVGPDFPVVGHGTGTGVMAETRPVSIQYGPDGPLGGSMVVLALGGAMHATTVSLTGYRTMGEIHEVTKMDGTMVLELDGRPATVVYDEDQEGGGGFSREAMAGEGAIHYALLRHPRGLHEAPALLAIYGTDEETQALVLAVHLSQGSHVQVVAMDVDTLTSGAADRLQIAEDRLGSPIRAVICADCYGWKLLLQSRLGEELSEIRGRYQTVPIVGMYSGGEIGNLAQLHADPNHGFANYVMSVALLG